MLKLFHTDNHKTHEVSEIIEGSWIKLQSPTNEEARRVAEALNVEFNDVMAAIDPEEKTRIEIFNDYTLIITDIPIKEMRHHEETYKTIPLGIIFNRENIVTICSEDTPLLNYFHENDIKDFSTKKRLKFIYQIMLRTSMFYQRALTDVDKKRVEFEEHIGTVRSESDLVKIHELESALVYFMTSLRGNNNVINRLARSNLLSHYPEDRELLDDVIIENQQAIEMAQIYREIIDGTRELISSIMNLRMNHVMKSLTSITVIFSIPMIISGMYGMNVDAKWMPLAQAVHGFGIIGLVTIFVCVIAFVVLKKNKMM